MIAYFCGNPFNHEPHEKNGIKCEGVNRQEVKEEIVEKFVTQMSEMAEDGTEYYQITILVENLKTGDTTIINAPKASRHMLEVEHQKYVALEYVDRDFTPQIERAIFQFAPYQDGEKPAFTVERIQKDAVS